MVINILLVFLDLFINAFNFIVLARIVMSWMVSDLSSSWFGRLMLDLTEPILGPIRKVLPRNGVLDLAPLVAILGLYALRTLVFNLILHAN